MSDSILGGGFVPSGATRGNIRSRLQGLLQSDSGSGIPDLAKSTISSAKQVFKPGDTVVGGFTMPDLGGFETDTAMNMAKAGGTDTPASGGGMTDLAKQGKAAALAGGMIATQAVLDSAAIDRAERSQMKLISEQFGIAREDLAANTNLRMMMQGAQEVSAMIDQIKEYERVKTQGPVQSQFFG